MAGCCHVRNPFCITTVKKTAWKRWSLVKSVQKTRGNWSVSCVSGAKDNSMMKLLFEHISNTRHHERADLNLSEHWPILSPVNGSQSRWVKWQWSRPGEQGMLRFLINLQAGAPRVVSSVSVTCPTCASRPKALMTVTRTPALSYCELTPRIMMGLGKGYRFTPCMDVE